MWLFDVPTGRRVMVTSKKLRWVETESEKTVATDITWIGTTTDHYFTHGGVKRRLIVDHTFRDYPEGLSDSTMLWQRNIECFVVG